MNICRGDVISPHFYFGALKAFCATQIKWRALKVLCAIRFFDRSEQFRKIFIARDFTVRKTYRSFAAASTNSLREFKNLFKAKKYRHHQKIMSIFWRAEEDASASRLPCSSTVCFANSTRLHTSSLKNSPLDCFFTFLTLSEFESSLNIKNNSPTPKGRTVILAR